jgi:hypothetical protein
MPSAIPSDDRARDARPRSPALTASPPRRSARPEELDRRRTRPAPAGDAAEYILVQPADPRSALSFRHVRIFDEQPALGLVGFDQVDDRLKLRPPRPSPSVRASARRVNALCMASAFAATGTGDCIWRKPFSVVTGVASPQVRPRRQCVAGRCPPLPPGSLKIAARLIADCHGTEVGKATHWMRPETWTSRAAVSAGISLVCNRRWCDCRIQNLV